MHVDVTWLWDYRRWWRWPQKAEREIRRVTK